METLESSKSYNIIREDNGEIRAMTGKWERELGDILKIDGVRWKVCMLHKDNFTARCYLGAFSNSNGKSSHLFRFHNFNHPQGGSLV